MVLTALTVYFAASFRVLRHQVRKGLQDDSEPLGSRFWFRQWPVMVVGLVGLLIIWLMLASSKSPNLLYLWRTLGVVLSAIMIVYWHLARGR